MDRRFQVLFWLAPLIHIFLYSFHGFADNDHGFITALSWRIVNGELPYRDFIYIRPPLSPLLHAIPILILPDQIEYAVIRTTPFWMLAIVAWLLAKTLNEFYPLSRFRIPIHAFALVAYLLSIQHFPPYPWHTIDGLLFGSIGIWLIVRHDRPWIVALAMVCLFLSALTKQSFYPVPLLGVIYLLLIKGWRPALLGTAVLGGLAGLFFAIMQMIGILTPFIAQVTGATNMGDLHLVGVKTYALYSQGFLVVTSLAIFAILNWLIRFTGKRPIDPAWAAIFFVTLFFISWSYLTYKAGMDELSPHTILPPYSFSQILLLLGLWICLDQFHDHRQLAVGLGILLGTAWCSSISWGYSNPLIASGPLLFCLFYFLKEKVKTERMIPALLGVVLFGAMINNHILRLFPFEDAPRHRLAYNLGKVFPKLSHVYTNERRFAKHRELKSLIDKHGDRFTVLPSMTLANYATDTVNPARIDWAQNIELNYEWEPPSLALDASNATVFIDKDHFPIEKAERHRSLTPRHPTARRSATRMSRMTYHVYKNWDLIEQGQYLDVYRPALGLFTPGSD